MSDLEEHAGTQRSTLITDDIGGPGPEGAPIAEPLVTHIYTADPSAHVFNGRLYIYPSHDVELEVVQNDDGDHFGMSDYHVLSMDEVGGEVTDHGVALSLEDIPWAGRQLWAPDAAHRSGKFYLYFPMKDKEDIFRIGVAVSDKPEGPFTPEPEPMKGSFSIDPAVFEDDSGDHFMYLGGIWGGQLQRWTTGEYQDEDSYPADNEPALMPKVARLNKDMTSLAEPLKDVVILDENNKPLKAGDKERRYFEGPWMHKYKGKYYFSYSTGDTHKIVYAVGDNPYGPFTYQGVVLNPVVGWTNHHSITEFKGKWYLFYHDSCLSGGVTHLRTVKMTELHIDENGVIQTIDAYE